MMTPTLDSWEQHSIKFNSQYGDFCSGNEYENVVCKLANILSWCQRFKWIEYMRQCPGRESCTSRTRIAERSQCTKPKCTDKPSEVILNTDIVHNITNKMRHSRQKCRAKTSQPFRNFHSQRSIYITNYIRISNHLKNVTGECNGNIWNHSIKVCASIAHLCMGNTCQWLRTRLQ